MCTHLVSSTFTDVPQPEDPDSILVNTGNDRTLLLKLLKAVEHNANRLEMDPRGNEMAVVRRESISRDPTSRS